MTDIRMSQMAGIPFGDNAGRPSNPGTGQPYFNGQTQRLELYAGSLGWQNIVSETPSVTSYTGNVIETDSTNTITVNGTNFTVGATVLLIGNDGTEYAASSSTVNNATSITAVFGTISQSKEPYDIKVTNPSNLYGIYYDILTVNDKPSWVTAAGSLGTFQEQSSISTSVLSVSDEENNTITYSLASGSSLPSGLSLNSSTGVISGTLPDIASDTTYTFTINASDGFNAGQPRTFSITSLAQFAIEYLIVGGGGAGGHDVGGGGGAGGLLSGTIYKGQGDSTTITVGNGAPAITSQSEGPNDGQSSVAFNLTAFGGGGGGNWMSTGSTSSKRNGNPGGSGGGGGGWNQIGYGGSGTNGQGYAGGDALSGQNGSSGGGGGGAGGAGQISQTGNSAAQAAGGIGVSNSITGTSVTYATGGKGGGDTTSDSLTNNGTDGLGNGGDGQGLSAYRRGGSGVVIIAYPNSKPALTIGAGLSYDQPTRSGYRVYRFTAGTGTITI